MQDEEQSSSGVRVPPPLVYLAALGAGFLLQRWLPMPLAGSGTEVAPVRDAGYLLLVSAIALAGWAVGTFRQIGTSLNPSKTTSSLVIGGP